MECRLSAQPAFSSSNLVSEEVLIQKLLPDIRQLSEFYMFQQDTAPAHRACKTVDLVTRETPDFIPHALAVKQPILKSSGLQSVVSNAGRLQRADQGCR